MLAIFVLLPAVLADDCSLPDSIDPNDQCVITTAGGADYGSLDVGGGPDSAVTLTISAMPDGHQDHTRHDHVATAGTLSEDFGNDRYLLDCATNGTDKTIQLTVTRPTSLGSHVAFGAEWVQMYRKDSWTIEQSEHEPFTFNDFGSKVPLPEFRPGSSVGLGDNSLDESVELNVYMTVNEPGDFEFKFGSPNLVYGATTLDPLADCVGDEAAWSAACGTWTALEFSERVLRVGTPWSTGGICGATENTNTAGGAIVPLYVGHPNLASDNYDDFKDALATLVGSDSTNGVTIYVVLDIFTPGAGNTDGSNPPVVFADNAAKWTRAVNGDGYTMCYKAGPACPANDAVCEPEHCNIERWNQIIEDLKGAPDGVTVKVLGLIDASTIDMQADVDAYNLYIDDLDGFLFTDVSNDDSDQLDAVATFASSLNTFTVLQTGEWLNNDDVLNKVNVVVTQSGKASAIEEWNPFSWYPNEPPNRWAALVTASTDIEGDMDMMFDRGYGYVYMTEVSETDRAVATTVADTSDGAWGTPSANAASTLQGVLANFGGPSGSDRRLQEVSDGVATYKWGCDSTQYQCTPVCLKTKGLTMTNVAESNCAGVAPDPCGCTCFFDAAWTCDGETVVCSATHSKTLDTRRVGDLVCSSRGTQKPELDTFDERIAGKCEKKPVRRGDYPTDTCMIKFQEEKAEREAAAAAAAAALENARQAAAAMEAAVQAIEAEIAAVGTRLQDEELDAEQKELLQANVKELETQLSVAVVEEIEAQIATVEAQLLDAELNAGQRKALEATVKELQTQHAEKTAVETTATPTDEEATAAPAFGTDDTESFAAVASLAVVMAFA